MRSTTPSDSSRRPAPRRVKLEGGGPMVSRAARDRRGRHPGHGPPRPHPADGDHRSAGSRRRAAPRRRRASCYVDALALQQAGCFALVLEAVPARVAGHISDALSIPTIGIGAGPDCDGQVLVWHDLLGINEGPMPRFVKRYADVAGEIRRGLEAFAAEVRDGTFPSDEHIYKISNEEYDLFASEVELRGPRRRRLDLGDAPLDRLADRVDRRDAERHERLGRQPRPVAGARS